MVKLPCSFDSKRSRERGGLAAALMARASELLSQPPTIEMVDVLAAKVPAAMSTAAST